MSLEKIAWISTLLCVLISARTANKFFQSKLRFFTIMALFALNWALLLMFYGEDKSHSEILSGYSGALMVYIGGLLVLEATQQNSEDMPTVARIQKIGLMLFGVLAIPSVPFDIPIITRPQFEKLISTTLDLCGFVSLCYGFNKLIGVKLFKRMMLLVCIIYCTAETAYMIQRWSIPSKADIEWYYLLTFSTCKLAVTLLLGYSLVKHHKVDGTNNFFVYLTELF